MSKIQEVLSIGDEAKEVNDQILAFLKKLSEIAFQMLISDPPLIFDIKKVGEKVPFNSYKYDSMDGFVKQGDECYIILPPVCKFNSSNQGGLGEVVIKPSILPMNYEFP